MLMDIHNKPLEMDNVNLFTRGGISPIARLVAVHVADPPGAVKEPRSRERGGAFDYHDEIAAQLPGGGFALCDVRDESVNPNTGNHTDRRICLHLPAVRAPVQVRGVAVCVGYVVVAARLIDCGYPPKRNVE